MSFSMDDRLRARLRACAEKYLADANGCHRLDHTVRVVGNALRLAASYPAVDLLVLEAAAWLHDIGRGVERQAGVSHAILSARLAGKILPAEGLTVAQTQVARDAIATHRFSEKRIPATLEGRLLQDADRLDALGAIGIARTFSDGALRALYHPDDPFAEHRPPNDLLYTLDHFYAKLLRLPDTLHTPEARSLAAARVQYMRDFLQQLACELGTIRA